MALIPQVGPPLLLLPLFAASFNVTWVVAWGVGMLAALISVVTLLIGMVRRGAVVPVFRCETMLRPLLTILIVSGAYGVALLVQDYGERYARELVAGLQRECKQQGRCPVAPPGWQLDGKYARTTRGHWSFTYFTDSSRSEFGLWIHKANEAETCVHGGSSITLNELASVQCRNDLKLPLK